MLWKKVKNGIDREQNEPQYSLQSPITLEALKHFTAGMLDAEIIERPTYNEHKVTLLYISSLIDRKRLDQFIIEPLNRLSKDTVYESLTTSKISEIATLEQAITELMQGAVVLSDTERNQWWAIPLENPLGRAIESSETETILYGAKDSFTEQIDKNITLLRRRLPLAALKTEKFTAGSLTKTPVVLMYIEGLTNPAFMEIARKKIAEVDFDLILESSQLAAFIEEHGHSVFPQFLQTDRPDSVAYFLGIGKLTILVGNTPFALVAPTSFFDLFVSPEDYINRWVVASVLRIIRYVGYFISMTLIPLYVALTSHHYQMLPLQHLFVLLESRSRLPFSPFWEAALMLITLEIIKEASLRMPTKSGQTLGVIGGIVVGQAAVAAGFASKVLIVLVGIAAIASFLVPNYMMARANTLVQFFLLVLSSLLGMLGIVLGFMAVLIHLNGLSSLNQPYFVPVTPLHMHDWKDLFIRAPLTTMKNRPEHLRPLKKLRFSRRR